MAKRRPTRNLITLGGSIETYAKLLGKIEIQNEEGRDLNEQGFAITLEMILDQTKKGKKLCFIGN